MLIAKELDETARKIMETAQTLFDKHGIEEVSMHQVAQEAGIGQGTLYRRFPNKNKLCLSLMEEKFERFVSEVDVYLQSSAEQSAAQRLTVVMSKLIMLACHDVSWVKQIMSADRLHEANAHCFEFPPFKFVCSKVSMLLEEAASNGELIEVEPQITAFLLASSLSPESMYYLLMQNYTAEQIAEHFCRSFVQPLFVDKKKGI